MSSTCYFDLLAPELIQLIFIYCIDRRDRYFVEYKVDAPPLVLLRVCKRWQNIAFQTAGLFDSISLRRRVHAPHGFDFNLDSWVLYTFLHFPRARYRLRPLAMQLCYGDIKTYGNRLMWSDLLRMVRIIIERTENLERLYLRFPDDCMEKLLMKVCSEAGEPIKHDRLRSLTLHSTRETLLQRRYISWWYDQAPDYMPAYYHKLDTSQLPMLEELGLHFPGPLTLDPICRTVRKLHVSLFKWEQLEQYLESCPRTDNLIIELREPLLDQDWDTDGLNPEVRFSRIRRLEIRSALRGWACSNKLLKLFLGLRMPNLRVLRLRRLPQSDRDEPPLLRYGALIMGYLSKLEELELIDFPPEGYVDWSIGAVFAGARNLKRLAYREEEMVSSPQYFTHLISELTFFGTELRAPRLEILELDSIHLRQGESTIIQSLLQLIASRRNPAFFVNTGSKRRQRAPTLPCLLRRVCLPFGCSDIVRRMDVFGMCRGVELDCIPTLEKLELENDLDEEGPPRDQSFDWQPLQWRTFQEPKGRNDSCTSEPSRSISETQSLRETSTLLPTESVVEVEKMLLSKSDEERDKLSRSSSGSQESFGLSRLDSLAEVELML